MNNYFRVGRAVFTFDQRDPESVRDAWEQAQIQVGRVEHQTRERPRVVCWRGFRSPVGPWTGGALVGFWSPAHASIRALPEMVLKHQRELQQLLDEQWGRLAPEMSPS